MDTKIIPRSERRKARGGPERIDAAIGRLFGCLFEDGGLPMDVAVLFARAGYAAVARKIMELPE